MKRDTYTATVTVDDGWWMISVPAVDVVTHSRRLDHAESIVRHLVSTSLGIKPDTFDVVVSVAR